MDTRTSGAASTIINKPSTSGGMAPLGETFKVDPNSGGGTYAVLLELPKGRMGLVPSLTLQYSTNFGNSAFGHGWSLGVGAVTRQTRHGQPSYTDNDVFVLTGLDDLVPLGDGL